MGHDIVQRLRTSVTGCSTCSRGFSSRKQKVWVSGPRMIQKTGDKGDGNPCPTQTSQDFKGDWVVQTNWTLTNLCLCMDHISDLLFSRRIPCFMDGLQVAHVSWSSCFLGSQKNRLNKRMMINEGVPVLEDLWKT